MVQNNHGNALLFNTPKLGKGTKVKPSKHWGKYCQIQPNNKLDQNQFPTCYQNVGSLVFLFLFNIFNCKNK